MTNNFHSKSSKASSDFSRGKKSNLIGSWECTIQGFVSDIALSEDGSFSWVVRGVPTSQGTNRGRYTVVETHSGESQINVFYDNGTSRVFVVESMTANDMHWVTPTLEQDRFHLVRSGSAGKKKRSGRILWLLLAAAVVVAGAFLVLRNGQAPQESYDLAVEEPAATRTSIPQSSSLEGFAEIDVRRANLDAWERLNQGNPEAEQLPAGVIEVLLEVSVKNSSEWILRFSADEFFLEDREGNSYSMLEDSPYGQCFISGFQNRSFSMFSEDEVEGSLCFRVPEDVGGWMLGIQDLRVEIPGTSQILFSPLVQYNDAYEALSETGFWGQSVEEGMQVVVVDALVRSEGDQDLRVTSDGFYLIDDKGEQYPVDCAGFRNPSSTVEILWSEKEESSGLHIASGEFDHGVLCFVIPADRLPEQMAYIPEDPFTPGFKEPLMEAGSTLEIVMPGTAAEAGAHPDHSGGLTLTVDSVNLDGWNMIREDYSAYRDPPEESLVVIDVTIEGGSDRPVLVSDGDFDLYSGSGEILRYSTLGYCEHVPSPLISGSGLHPGIEIQPNSMVSGQLCFEVDPGLTIQRLVFSGAGLPPAVFDLTAVETAVTADPLPFTTSMRGSSGLEIEVQGLRWAASESGSEAQLDVLLRNSGDTEQVFFGYDLFLTSGSGEDLPRHECMEESGRNLNFPGLSDSTNYLTLAPGEAREGVLCYGPVEGMIEPLLMFDGDPVFPGQSITLPGSDPALSDLDFEMVEQGFLELSDGLTVEVLQFEQEGWKLLEELNPERSEPQGLRQLVVFDIALRAGETPVELAPGSLLLARSDGFWITPGHHVLPSPLFPDGQILRMEAGEAAEGQIVFEFLPFFERCTDRTGEVCFDYEPFVEDYALLFSNGGDSAGMLGLPDIRGEYLTSYVDGVPGPAPLLLKLIDMDRDAGSWLEEAGFEMPEDDEVDKYLYLELQMCAAESVRNLYLHRGDIYLLDGDGVEYEQICPGCMENSFYANDDDYDVQVSLSRGECHTGGVVFALPDEQEGLQFVVNEWGSPTYSFELPLE